MPVLHVITDLNIGGAETMLAKLVEHGAGRGEPLPEILSLLPPGGLADRVRRAGATVHSLAMCQGWASAGAAVRLGRTVRRLRPDLIQGWMHHGNVAATVAATLSGTRPPVVWNIRHSLVDVALEKPLSRAVLRMGRVLSRTPDRIIYNSAVAKAQYEAFGYAGDRGVVIPNGFDCTHFRPRDGAGDALRRQFGIAPGALVAAMVARQHPMKDTANLVRAVGLARAAGHDLHLLLAGKGSDALPLPLADLIARTIPADRLFCAGERDDVAQWLSGVDILALPSAWGEAFPNVLGEAMACGVACVTTDVGDSAAIVGDLGRVVPPRDPAALAAAIGDLAGLGVEGRAQLGAAARASILKRYTLGAIAARYAELHATVLAEHRAASPRRSRVAAGSAA